MKSIECRELFKTYGRCKAIDDLTFSIEENTITGVIGRNGAGKTTLLKILSGFLRPTSGSVNVFGENPFNNLDTSMRTIFIDENMSYPKELNLWRIIESASNFYPKFDKIMGEKLMEYFNLDKGRKFNELSKGMKSTFNMIIGIASHSDLTIMDEPTTGMDAAVRKDFYKIILRDYIESPRTFLLSSHHLEELEELLEDIFLLKDGKKCMHMPLTDIKEYAVGLSGKENLVRGFVESRKILYEEAYGKDSLYMVAEAGKDKVDINRAKSLGIDLKPVSANDICIYITNPKEGGINYVFEK